MNRLPPPFVIKLVIRIRNWLHGLADKLMPPHIRMMMSGCGFMKSISIHTAAKLHIADHLANGSKSIDELAKATSTHADLLYRLMRALASEGIFLCAAIFGATVTNSDGKRVPVRTIGEQHVMDDLGWIPSVKDWLQHIELQPWMGRTPFRPQPESAGPVVCQGEGATPGKGASAVTRMRPR